MFRPNDSYFQVAETCSCDVQKYMLYIWLSPFLYSEQNGDAIS